MQVDHVSLGIRLVLSDEMLRAKLAASPADIGLELARAIDKYCSEQQLGYYPAIEFFRQAAGFDQQLIDHIEQVSWQVSKLAREEVQSRLRPIFSTVKFQSVQTEAFALPPVRPSQDNALDRLVQHCTVDTVKLELQVSMLRKDNDQRGDAAEGYARKMMYRWLGSVFEEVQITASSPRSE
jgi:hypothetical protein